MLPAASRQIPLGSRAEPFYPAPSSATACPSLPPWPCWKNYPPLELTGAHPLPEPHLLRRRSSCVTRPHDQATPSHDASSFPRTAAPSGRHGPDPYAGCSALRQAAVHERQRHPGGRMKQTASGPAGSVQARPAPPPMEGWQADPQMGYRLRQELLPEPFFSAKRSSDPSLDSRQAPQNGADPWQKQLAGVKT